MTGTLPGGALVYGTQATVNLKVNARVFANKNKFVSLRILIKNLA
jgi:hypothetical protein